MRVRIIAGEFGGRFIQAPPGSTTHPMGERVRSAMFNSLGETVRGARVLDAFAGSGAIGLEALSRCRVGVFCGARPSRTARDRRKHNQFGRR